MKTKIKISIFGVVLLGTLFFSSCESNFSYPEDLHTKQVLNYEVRASDWVLNAERGGLNPYYSCHFNVRGLNTGTSQNHCAVLAYIHFDDGSETPLPYTRHFENAQGARWTRTIDFDYTLSDINFYVTNSDFANDPPEKMYFRVVYIW